MAAIEDVKVGLDFSLSGEALKLERGCTYVIESDQHLSVHAFECCQQVLSEAGEKHGVTFMLLDKGMRIARYAANQFDPAIGGPVPKGTPSIVGE